MAVAAKAVGADATTTTPKSRRQGMSPAMSMTARRKSNVVSFRKRLEGELRKHLFVAYVQPSEETKRKCASCGGRIIRSHLTGILHKDCFTCRYLKMIYGPNIKIERRED